VRKHFRSSLVKMCIAHGKLRFFIPKMNQANLLSVRREIRCFLDSMKDKPGFKDLRDADKLAVIDRAVLGVFTPSRSELAMAVEHEGWGVWLRQKCLSLTLVGNSRS